MTAVWLIHIILESWEWGSNWRMRKWKKLLQTETASQKSLQNGLNEAEMKEILRPKSNLEGPKSRLPIGQEPKIEASDWSRADDFKNSSHRPFVKKFLSLHSFWHHSGVFGVIPKTKSHFAVIESIMETAVWLIPLHSKFKPSQSHSTFISFLFIQDSFTSFSSHFPMYSSHSTDTPPD